MLAGIYDMIDVDDGAIKQNLKIIRSWEEGGVNGVNLDETLKETVFFASRKLLVNRGEEPRTDGETLKILLDDGEPIENVPPVL